VSCVSLFLFLVKNKVSTSLHLGAFSHW